MATILGISGLDRSVGFKKSRFPGLDWRQYRMVQGFDSAAALLVDGRLTHAVAEERFTGEKGTGAFPVNSINSCLSAVSKTANEIDVIAHGFSYEPLREAMVQDDMSRDRFEEVYSRHAQLKVLQDAFSGDWNNRFIQVPHHLAHGASAFYPSGFETALVVVTDGMGEKESLTVATASAQGIDPIAMIPGTNSIGILYSLFTHYLGFAFNVDEYKVMGLAPHGNRERYLAEIMDLVRFREDGTYTIPILYRNPSSLDRETYRGTLDVIAEMFGPPRHPHDELTKRHADLAAGIQAVLECSLLHVLRHFAAQTSLTNLCMAGGVALNCTANGAILGRGIFDRLYVQPAAGDDGAALGAALFVHKEQDPTQSFLGTDNPLVGPSYADDEIAAVLEMQPDCRWKKYESFAELAAQLSSALAHGKIAGLFQGELEYGPRALGNRSILGDPRRLEMREIINRKVKKREAFRPFAPAVDEGAATKYFEIAPENIETYASMLFTAQVKAEYRETLPAVTHVDGSARVQTVSRGRNPRFWKIIDAFRAETGVPVVLNTSFNVRGQPIVRTPSEALDTFRAAKLDLLAIGNYLVEPTYPTD